MNLTKIREKLEAEGFVLTDADFEEVVGLARRKLAVSQKGEKYLQYLLPDVIREWVIRQNVNMCSMSLMHLLKENHRR